MLGNTIAAIATPPGSGGIGIIRISGPDSRDILRQVFRPAANIGKLTPRHLYLGHAISPDGEAIDQIMAVYMPAPHSYTGEDVAELQCHGGYVVCREVLAAALAAGAVPAEPGEFTSRAFINGKMSLDQAEAVIDIIEAKSSEALKISARQLSGSLQREIAAAADGLLDLLAELEMAVDYPEETDEQALADRAEQAVKEAAAAVRRLLSQAKSGRYYRDGVLTAIIGPPNAGKSTLLNALLECDRSIVTPMAGTTRDTIEEYYLLNGLPLRLVDTAGIRDTDDPIEQFGVERSKKALADADLILLLLDGSQPIDDFWRDLLPSIRQRPLLILLNKSDLPACDATLTDITELCSDVPLLRLSAKNGGGLDGLRAAIHNKLLTEGGGETLSGLINDRQKAALLSAEKALLSAGQHFELFFDAGLLSVDVQVAWQYLAEISGRAAAESVIDRVFERFCLGK